MQSGVPSPTRSSGFARMEQSRPIARAPGASGVIAVLDDRIKSPNTVDGARCRYFSFIEPAPSRRSAARDPSATWIPQTMARDARGGDIAHWRSRRKIETNSAVQSINDEPLRELRGRARRPPIAVELKQRRRRSHLEEPRHRPSSNHEPKLNPALLGPFRCRDQYR